MITKQISNYKNSEVVPFNDLLNKTITDIYSDDDLIIFETSCGSRYEMLHQQDCCENVYVESIVGDISDLLHNPILFAEEVTNSSIPGSDDSYTWTFYKLATIKGYVDIRWFGTSNGYYSESVDFCKMNKPELQ